MDKTDTIILITEEFPLGGITEKSFVLPDIIAMADRVKHLLIVPLLPDNDRTCGVEMPSNVEICRDWCDSITRRYGIMRCLRYVPSKEVIKVLREGATRKNITYAAASVAFSHFLLQLIRRRNIDASRLTVYSFWFNFAASGVYLAACKMGFRYVIRAHGYDYKLACAKSLRQRTVDNSIGIYVCSRFGAEYLRKNLIDSDRIFTSYLGVEKNFPEVLTKWHTSGEHCVTIMSVSRVIPRKRVQMNLRFMKALAVARPSTRFKWIHIGDGECMAEIAEEAAQNLPSNLEVDLRGELDNDSLHKIYRDETVDWLMLLSQDEPLGLVLVEALAYGVPVIASAVGGIPEVVTDECGILLDKDSSPEEFVRGIVPYLDSDYRMEQLRTASYNRWVNLFDAVRLRKDFADSVLR
ncbi:MAG: glycosyltransferase [Paramuribaculum sp.]|nr:glycosyltransferase [Paramuribaculum sp.]